MKRAIALVALVLTASVALGVTVSAPHDCWNYWGYGFIHENEGDSRCLKTHVMSSLAYGTETRLCHQYTGPQTELEMSCIAMGYGGGEACAVTGTIRCGSGTGSYTKAVNMQDCHNNVQADRTGAYCFINKNAEGSTGGYDPGIDDLLFSVTC
jgi:hypothetical protein